MENYCGDKCIGPYIAMVTGRPPPYLPLVGIYMNQNAGSKGPGSFLDPVHTV